MHSSPSPFVAYLRSAHALLSEASSRPTIGSRLFSTSPARHVQTQAERRRMRDPYALAQSRQRKNANLARQVILKKARAAAIGHPVQSKATPFINSLDTPETSASADAASLNHFLTPTILNASLSHSSALTAPATPSSRSTADPAREAQEAQLHTSLHANATSAISRIVSLSNGSRSDLTRVNVQRCISHFGRHSTDSILAPKPPSNVPRGPDAAPQPQKTPRAGPDTGSPEVQIAILTTKIRVLAKHLAGEGRKDKMNKRNLQVLVHKRQKLLRYLRRKERGGERWQNVVKELGLEDGAWKGEISLS